MFLRNLVEAGRNLYSMLMWKRICNYCEGKGKIQLGFRGSPTETVVCSVCSGKGVL